MDNNYIRAFGIFINDFPYFMLAFVGVLDYLKVPVRKAFFRGLAMTVAHAFSILLLMEFYPGYQSIQTIHEIVFLVLYVLVFIWTVKTEASKLLFMALFVKLFGGVVSDFAAYLELYFFANRGAAFNLNFNLINLGLLVVLYPPMYVFASRKLRPLIRMESALWRYLWLLPLMMYLLSIMFSLSQKILIFTWQHTVLDILLLAFSVLLYTLIADTFESTREKTLLEAERTTLETLLTIQDEEYELLTASIESTRQARHDLRHQIAAIRGLLQANDNEGALRHCDEIASHISTTYDHPLCDNLVVSAVAQYYVALVQEAGIELDQRLDIPETIGGLKNSDLCVVVGNLLENALEACKRQKKGKRFITLYAQRRHEYLTLTMDNSFDGKLYKQGETFMSRKHSGNGIGLSSIKRIAERSGGEAYFENKGKTFRSSVILRMDNK